MEKSLPLLFLAMASREVIPQVEIATYSGSKDPSTVTTLREATLTSLTQVEDGTTPPGGEPLNRYVMTLEFAQIELVLCQVGIGDP